MRALVGAEQQLAEACREHAQQLVGQEARVAEREQRLAELTEALAERWWLSASNSSNAIAHPTKLDLRSCL